MSNIRTDVGTFAPGLGVPGQQAAMTAQDVTALTGAGSQTETGAGAQTETSAVADAPSGDSTNGFSSTNDKATAVACINRNKVRIAEHRTIIAAAVVRVAENRTVVDAAVVRIGELDVLQVKILARVKELEDALENIGIFAKN